MKQISRESAYALLSSSFIRNVTPYFAIFGKQWHRLKFIYSEKATKFCKIFTLLFSYVVPVKCNVKISPNFVAFSEYMNFKSKRKRKTLYCSCFRDRGMLMGLNFFSIFVFKSLYFGSLSGSWFMFCYLLIKSHSVMSYTL